MSDTVFVNKAAATPSVTAASAGSVSLPPELLAEASRRLGWAGLVYAFTYAAAYFGPQIVRTLSQPGYTTSATQNVAASISIALGLGVFALSRRAHLAPQSFLNLGLVFAVVGALGISIAEFSQGFALSALDPSIRLDPVVEQAVLMSYRGVPWESLWIILFPLIAPNTPGRILAASLGSASMGPLTLLVVSTVGGVDLHAPASMLVTHFLFTNYLSAVLAFVIARIIVGFGVRLKKAREVGSYELVREIGSGGMGEVWVARHRMLARPAAVKLIRPELLGADHKSRDNACRRFEREAQSTAGLGSMHTVSIYDFGVTDAGAFFYVMELLDGLSLDALVTRYGPVDCARAVYLLRQVCHSLGDAHEQGLIHRDVKPANIFTCRLGPDYDFVKVLDFGLVKQRENLDRTDLTADGVTAGTPAFMAPEMALATPGLDGRADLYAVGCVAYWLLTGHHVFEGETPMATILKHVSEAPVAPSSRTELQIPAGLETVILSCLEKDPADRPQTAGELSLRLQASLCSDPWSHYDARDWWERHQPNSEVA